MFFKKKAPDGSVPAPLPPREKERLAALRSYDILDTLPEATYDDFVLIASTICQTPIALVSLIDGERQWFKARHGLDATETSRDSAFCAHAILDSAPLVVDDTLNDPRFATNPLVLGDPNIRFYAGVPLVTPDGHALGTICVIDRKPRHIDDEQKRALQAVSRQVIAQLELRRMLARMQSTLGAETPRVASPDSDPGDRARKLLAQSDALRANIRDLLGRVDHIHHTKKPDK